MRARLDAARTAARARAAATRFRLALPVTGGHARPVLFAAYHLHFPWLIPVNLLDMFILSYPTKRYQSAWIGIVDAAAWQTCTVALIVVAATSVSAIHRKGVCSCNGRSRFTRDEP